MIVTLAAFCAVFARQFWITGNAKREVETDPLAFEQSLNAFAGMAGLSISLALSVTQVHNIIDISSLTAT